MLKSYNDALDRPHPAKLFLEITTRCNLRCKMCVKQSIDSDIKSGDMALSTFEALEPAISKLDEVIVSGVGEPLLHPRLEEFIVSIKKRLPPSGSVGLQTNGTLLTHSRIKSLLSVDLDTICLSVDAANPDLLNAIRAGAKIEQIETALRHLDRARRSLCPAPLVGIQFVLMQDNMFYLPQVLRWASRLGVDFAIVSHLLPFDAGLSNQVVYPLYSDAAMELFHKWKQKISRSGFEIEEYPSASMKYYKNRTANQKRLIQMVDAMKSEACRKGLSLDLTRLMAPQAGWAAQVDDIFEEALAVAQGTGLDLILPARQPSHTRHCSFIEEGSVFVAWDGSVFPCHFAWHPYACYPNGRKKVVQPVCFGRVESKPLIGIWNTAEFKSFRKNVLLYDYPYCGDCGLSPCDYIDGQVFEQDCHTNTVPCCDCPWPTGILNCLQ